MLDNAHLEALVERAKTVITRVGDAATHPDADRFVCLDRDECLALMFALNVGFSGRPE